MRRMFGAAWQPLQEPLRGVDALQRWQRLLGARVGSRSVGLGTGQDAEYGEYADLFSSMVNEALMTRLRRCVTNEWDVHNAAPMVELIQAWQPLLDEHLVANILDQLIFPKLRRELDAWSPKTATVPIHHWVHPWLPVAAERIGSFTPVIRQKLNAVLGEWEAEDESAHVLLAPWHGVFETEAWNRMVLDHIVPKLVLGLRGAVLDASAAEGGGSAWQPLQWAQRWESLLPGTVYAAMIEHELLFKWLGALHRWLSAPGAPPDIGAVMEWYEGWKTQLGPEVQAEANVQAMLGQALRMFNELMEGETIAPPTKPYPPRFDAQGYLSFAPGADAQADIAATSRRHGTDDNPQGITYKDVVERFAAQIDVVFMPTTRTRGDGGRVYQFGSASIAIDTKENLVYLQDAEGGTDGWRLVGLEELGQLSNK